MGELIQQASDPLSIDPRLTDPCSTDPRSTDPRSTDPRSTDPQSTSRRLVHCGSAYCTSVDRGQLIADQLAAYRLGEALLAYDEAALQGAPEKHIWDEGGAILVGCEFLAARRWALGGACLSAAPLARRLPLSVLCAKLATLPCGTPALMRVISGSLTSAYMFRRLLISLMGECHSYGCLLPLNTLRPIPCFVRDGRSLWSIGLAFAALTYAPSCAVGSTLRTLLGTKVRSGLLL